MVSDSLVRKIGTGLLVVASMLPYSGCSKKEDPLARRIEIYTEKVLKSGEADKEEVERFWEVYRAPANEIVVERLKAYGKGNVNLREHLKKHPDKDFEKIVENSVTSGVVRNMEDVCPEELELLEKVHNYSEVLEAIIIGLTGASRAMSQGNY